jgi:hypothetical protein
MTLNNRAAAFLNRKPVLAIIGLVVFSLLTLAVYNATENNIPGTDFFIYYVAARQITVEHGSPYADTVGEQSQMAILKHLSRPGEDQLRYVYPPYGLLPVLPLSFLSIRWAQAAWLSFCILCLPVCLIFAFRKVPPIFLTTLFFLYPLTFGLLLGNLNIPVICILLLVAGRLPGMTGGQRVEPVLLGFLLAWATVKPQFSALYILIFLLMAFRKRIWRFLAGFFAGLLALLLTSFMLVPDWIQQWLTLIRGYPTYTGSQVIVTPLVDLFPAGSRAAVYLILVILGGVLLGWLLLRWWDNRTTTLDLLCVGTAALFLFHPTGVSYEQMIFLLPFALWILCGWQKRPALNTVLWLIMVTLSWVLVYLNLSHAWDRATYYGMYFLYLLWLIAFLLPGIYAGNRTSLPGE